MNIENSLLKIVCGNKQGTAFLIDKKHAITAEHCITAAFEGKIIELFAFGENIKPTIAEYELCDGSELVYLTLKDEIEYSKEGEIVYTPVRSFTEWKFFGYGSSYVVGAWKKIHSIGREIFPEESTYDLLFQPNGALDASFGGFSGSPILNNELKIAGFAINEIVQGKRVIAIEGVSTNSQKAFFEKFGIEVSDGLRQLLVGNNGEIQRYYSRLVADFESENRDGIMGPESLSVAYIPPFTEVDGKQENLLDHIEKWYQNTQPGVMLLYGEPGDGKTTFCNKVVYDFAKGNRFVDSKGVFFFQLSQLGTTIVNNTDICIENIFHRRNHNDKMFTLSDAEGMLILLDGFDEIKLSLVNTKINTYFEFMRYLSDIARDDNIHFIVTSRINAVKDDIKNTRVKSRMFLPLSYDVRKNWVFSRIGASGDAYKQYWNTYLKKVCLGRESRENSFRELLKIPFIFLMVMNQKYMMSDAVNNKAKLYEEIFELTVDRRFSENEKKWHLENYKTLAYNIWSNNEDTACSEEEIKDSLLYSYYLKEEQFGQVVQIGFIHRSIYQYFLALYLYEFLKKIDDQNKAYAFLQHLAHRRLEEDILVLFEQIASNHNNDVSHALKLLLNKLEETEAIIIDIPERGVFYNNDEKPFDWCNNIFINAINIASCFEIGEIFNSMPRLKHLLAKYNCSYLFTQKNDNTIINLNRLNLQYANLEGINLSYATMVNTNLSQARLYNGNFSNADMTRIKLRKAMLNGCNLVNGNMTNAYLEAADLAHADLRGVNFHGAILLGANLQGSSLVDINWYKTKINTTDFRRAVLANANLSQQKLKRCRFNNANLSFSDMSNSYLYECDFGGADLTGVNFQNANFENTLFRNTCLKKAIFHGVKHAHSAQWDRANLSEAVFSETELAYISLKNTDLTAAQFVKSNLRNANLTSAILKDCDFRGANLTNANLMNSQLSGIVFDKTTIIEKMEIASESIAMIPWKNTILMDIYIDGKLYRKETLVELLRNKGIL